MGSGIVWEPTGVPAARRDGERDGAGVWKTHVPVTGTQHDPARGAAPRLLRAVPHAMALRMVAGAGSLSTDATGQRGATWKLQSRVHDPLRARLRGRVEAGSLGEGESDAV